MAGPDVTVVNTTANPMPVVQQGPVSISGGISISGTPNVTVANTPSVTVANTPTVNLANGATVKISPETPVPVSLSTGQIFRFHVAKAHDDADPSPLGLPIYTVPAGKRLLVQYINAFTRGDQLSLLLSPGRAIEIPLVGGQATFQLQFNVEAGETLILFSNGDTFMWVTGSLVDAVDPVVSVEVCSPSFKGLCR
jgi:hypothetical protein